jgi:hypothetical protein
MLAETCPRRSTKLVEGRWPKPKMAVPGACSLQGKNPFATFAEVAGEVPLCDTPVSRETRR